jgi:hypothetical protein
MNRERNCSCLRFGVNNVVAVRGERGVWVVWVVWVFFRKSKGLGMGECILWLRIKTPFAFTYLPEVGVLSWKCNSLVP